MTDNVNGDHVQDRLTVNHKKSIRKSKLWQNAQSKIKWYSRMWYSTYTSKKDKETINTIQDQTVQGRKEKNGPALHLRRRRKDVSDCRLLRDGSCIKRFALQHSASLDSIKSIEYNNNDTTHIHERNNRDEPVQRNRRRSAHLNDYEEWTV